MQWYLEISLGRVCLVLLQQLLNLWQSDTERRLISCIIKRIIHIIETEVKLWAILSYTQRYRNSFITKQVTDSIRCSINILTVSICSIRCWFHIDCMSTIFITNRNRNLIRSGTVIRRCLLIDIPVERHIFKHNLRTSLWIDGCETSLKFNTRIRISTVHTIVSNDITIVIYNRRSLTNQLEQIAINRADVRRFTPLCIRCIWITISTYRDIILLTSLESKLMISENDVCFTISISLYHVDTIYRMGLTICL